MNRELSFLAGTTWVPSPLLQFSPHSPSSIPGTRDPYGCYWLLSWGKKWGEKKVSLKTPSTISWYYLVSEIILKRAGILVPNVRCCLGHPHPIPWCLALSHGLVSDSCFLLRLKWLRPGQPCVSGRLDLVLGSWLLLYFLKETSRWELFLSPSCPSPSFFSHSKT